MYAVKGRGRERSEIQIHFCMQPCIAALLGDAAFVKDDVEWPYNLFP
jgi:hypothetical protein